MIVFFTDLGHYRRWDTRFQCLSPAYEPCSGPMVQNQADLHCFANQNQLNTRHWELGVPSSDYGSNRKKKWIANFHTEIFKVIGTYLPFLVKNTSLVCLDPAHRLYNTIHITNSIECSVLPIKSNGLTRPDNGHKGPYLHKNGFFQSFERF